MNDYPFKTTPFPHQLEEWELSRDEPARALLWEQGCVSPDTEVLTETGWVRVDELRLAVRVAAWNPDDGSLRFHVPSHRKMFDCAEGIRIYQPGVTDQLVSPNHRVPYVRLAASDSKPVILAQDLLGKAQRGEPLPQLPLTFEGAAVPAGFKLIPKRLRAYLLHDCLGSAYRFGEGTLAVSRPSLAVIRTPDKPAARRYSNILAESSLYPATHLDESRDEYVVSYSRPLVETPPLYRGSNAQLEQVRKDVFSWAGYGDQVYCTEPEVADRIQYAFAAQGFPFRIEQNPRGTYLIKPVGVSVAANYTVTTEPMPWGKVYAFTVPTGFLLYRRNGLIFPSGNCGKSKPVVDTACWLYQNKKINAVIVVAPNGVHRNWVEGEIPDHTPDILTDDVMGVAYNTGKSSTKKHKALMNRALTFTGLSWLTLSYEAFATPLGKETVADFLQKRRVLFVLDEAHKAKNPASARVKSLIKAGSYAPYRRILTGTPVAVGPFDLYSQLKFLDTNFWKRFGLETYTEFKTHFGVFQKQWNPNIVRTVRNPVTGQKELQQGDYYDTLVSYRRLEELADILRTVSNRKTKAQVLPFLPPKVYERRVFSLTPEMSRMYQELTEEFMTWIGSVDGGSNDYRAAIQSDMFCGVCHGAGELEEDGYIYPCPACGHGDLSTQGGTPIYAELAMVRLIRLQQVTSGFIPVPPEEVVNHAEPIHRIPGDNPRLALLLGIVQERSTPVIVWARYRVEIDDILVTLAANGIKAVRYDGQVTEEGRAEAKARFQGFRAVYDRDGALVGRESVEPHERAQVFVGNPSAGSAGLTLTAAKTVVYYSNSFKLIDRLQSEDRAHRIGQEDTVTYIDLEAESTVDRTIVENLRKKYDIAAAITGDALTSWIV